MEIHTSIRLWAARLWGKILQPVQTWRAAPCCRCSSPKGCLEQHFGFLHNPIPQNTTPHMGAVCGSSPALSLLCFWYCLSALLRLISPFPCLIFLPRFTCAAVSPVSSCVSLECMAHFTPGVYILKMQGRVPAYWSRNAQDTVYLLQAASHSKVLCGLMKDFLLQELNVLTCQKCPSVIMLHSKDLSLQTEMVILCPCSGTTSAISSLVHN